MTHAEYIEELNNILHDNNTHPGWELVKIDSEGNPTTSEIIVLMYLAAKYIKSKKDLKLFKKMKKIGVI